MDWMMLFTGIMTFTGLFALLAGLNWLVIRLSLKAIETDIGHIKENLNNHITDTNKKIDELKEEFKKLDSKLDNRFDNLTTILISNKLEAPKK